MAFFDELGKKLSAAAGTAADKAKGLGEITKLKTQILGVQSDINSSLLELGRKVYEQEKRSPESAYAADCAAITGLYEQVESLRARIALVKSDDASDDDCIINTEEAPAEEGTASVKCPACGESIYLDPDAIPEDHLIVCPSCNREIEVKEEEAE